MRAQPEYHKLWITIVGLIFLNGAVLYYGVWPLLTEIFTLRANINEAEMTISSLDRERTHFLNIERVVSKEADIFKRIEDTSLSLAHPLPFIELLESLGKEQGLTVKLTVRDAPSGGYQNFQIMSEGDFPHVYTYLRLLELTSYQITFLNFQLEFFEKGSTENSIKAKSAPLQGSRVPIITRLTLDLKVRAH